MTGISKINKTSYLVIGLQSSDDIRRLTARSGAIPTIRWFCVQIFPGLSLTFPHVFCYQKLIETSLVILKELLDGKLQLLKLIWTACAQPLTPALIMMTQLKSVRMRNMAKSWFFAAASFQKWSENIRLVEEYKYHLVAVVVGLTVKKMKVWNLTFLALHTL